MREIDFRPNWYCVIRKRRRDTVIRACLLGVLALELGLGLLTVSSRKAEAKQQLASLHHAIKNQATVFQDLGELVVNLDELQAKRVLLSDVAGGAPVHAILAELSLLMPDSLALRELHYKQHRRIGDAASTETPPTGGNGALAESENELEVTGLGVTDGDIGLLMSRMAASALFGDVALVYSQPVIHENTAAREFRVTCTVPQFE